MGLKKGRTNNPAGRPKGARNKAGADLRETITGFLEGNFTKIQADFRKLTPRDRARLYVGLLAFALPRLNSIDVGIKPKVGKDLADELNGRKDEEVYV